MHFSESGIFLRDVHNLTMLLHTFWCAQPDDVAAHAVLFVDPLQRPIMLCGLTGTFVSILWFGMVG